MPEPSNHLDNTPYYGTPPYVPLSDAEFDDYSGTLDELMRPIDHSGRKTEPMYQRAMDVLADARYHRAAIAQRDERIAELEAELARLKQILSNVREIEREASLVLAQEAVYARNEKALTPNAPAAILQASKLLVDIEIACMALGLPLKDATAALAGPASEASNEIQRTEVPQ